MQAWIDAALAAVGLNKGALITGFIGSLLSFKFVVQLGAFGRGSTFLGGAFAAGLLSPLLVDWFSLKPTYIGGVGFVIGALSMSVLAAALQSIKNMDLMSFIKPRSGGGS